MVSVTLQKGSFDMVKIRKPYDPSTKVVVEFNEPSKTQQNMRDECDINNILKKYNRSGLVTHVNEHASDYGDYSDYEDYQSSLNSLLDAQNAFAELPSSIRKQFNNDPGEFLDFVSRPENGEKMVDLGLAVKKESIPVEDTSAIVNTAG